MSGNEAPKLRIAKDEPQSEPDASQAQADTKGGNGSAEGSGANGKASGEHPIKRPGKGGIVPPAEPWKPGQSGNPSGRAKGVRYAGDYLRDLHAASEAELERISGDVRLPLPKRAAAKHLLSLMDDDPDKAGRILDRLMDRTEGKPHQSQTIEHQRGEDAATIRQRLLGKLGQGGEGEGQDSSK